MTGTVTRVVADRGYAFVRGDEDGRDYFAHVSTNRQAFHELTVGAKVEFKVECLPTGRLRAHGARRLA